MESHHLGRVGWQAADLQLEVDELDQQTRSGWSIVMHGRSSAVSEPDALADLWAWRLTAE
jgi:hypothetical protein